MAVLIGEDLHLNVVRIYAFKNHNTTTSEKFKGLTQVTQPIKSIYHKLRFFYVSSSQFKDRETINKINKSDKV
jgi:hypothetical protein